MGTPERKSRFPRPLLAAAVVIIAATVTGLVIWSSRRAPSGGGAAAGAPSSEAIALGGGALPETTPASAVEGMVLDPEGRGVEGATVAALRQRERDEIMGPQSAPLPHITRSTADGHFRIESLQAARYTVAATAPGLTAAFVGGVRVSAGKTTGGVELRLRRDGVTLSGRVLDAGGGTIPGARIRATHMPTGPVDPGTIPDVAAFETQSDGSGAYRLQIPKGRQTVTAEFDGYAPVREFFELTADTTKDFRLEPAAGISGRVVTGEERVPVPGAEVLAETAERQFGSFVEPVTTDEQGAFRFTTLTAGSYRLRARKGNLVGSLAQPVTVTVAAPAEGIELGLLAGLAVDGTIRSRAGKPIPAARVSVFPDRPMGGPARPQQGKADAAGRYRVEGLQPGRYRMSVSADAFAPANIELELQARVSRDVTLEDGVLVKGVVLTSAGQPAVGAEVQATVRSLDRGGMGSADRATTDSQGRFELKRLVPGEATFTVKQAMEAATHGPETIATAEHKELTIRLAAGARVSGTITWDDRSVAPRIKIIGSGRGGGMVRVETESGSDGSFTVGPFPPGEIAVVAMPPGERVSWSSNARPEQADLKVAAGEHRTGVKLVASRRNGSIKGIVVAPNGKPVDGAGVRAAREVDGRAWKGSPGEGRTTSGVDGTFAIDGLTKGSYTLWASHPSFADGERTGVAVGAADAKVQLRAAASIAGVAVDSAGRPITAYTLAVMAVKPGESEGTRMMRSSSFETAPLQVRDAHGGFRADRLAPGSYDLLASAPDGRVARAAGVTVGEGENKRGVRLVAEAGISVTGRVLEYESGQPLVGVQVRVRGPNGQGPEATTDGSGIFSIDNAPRLPGLVATFEPARRTHVSEAATLPPARGGRVDLGTIKMLKIDPNNPNRGRIGISYSERDGKIVVNEVLPDSPGAKAGVQKGDVILSVDGQKPTDIADVVRAMRVDPDKVITVTVQRPGEAPREVTLKRAL